MNVIVLYGTKLYGGAMSTFGHACANCRKPFEVTQKRTFRQTRELASECCAGIATESTLPIIDHCSVQWVDVQDDLPDDQQRVLIFDPTAEPAQVIAYRHRGHWYDTEGSSRRWAPTFWTRLPSPEAR